MSLLTDIISNGLTSAHGLREGRKALGLSIEGASAAYGCGASSWGRYERGVNPVPADALLWVIRKCEEVGR